ncbi:FkbM family methyltransferase [Ferruginibacter lapsinanis]|uniref:FkbM family methyltransferase n=1 Tax=Ferruginibacter lapsinanis TaxID=563172 RepID=UPI001E33B317|nr:FkbM family methyltransferase [Ferruginibacter lapsinanis]UEG50420.1 FkbM family methyltransferase [Ferruginibacter lapsinanis]
MKVSQFIPPIIFNIYKKIRSTKAGRYKIGKYEIDIPPNFALPAIQKAHRLYDRFLPVLAKNLSHDKLIIDVGANIGDTTISMLQNCTNPIVCFEPSDIFFDYLKRNLNKLSPTDAGRVDTFKQLVGTGNLSGGLNHHAAGTATLQLSESQTTITHIPLDKLIDDSSNVILLKVDTDGFDFDVIKSAEKILSNSEPILFWENEISEDFQYEGFETLYTLLIKKGYKYIYIFDNFGNLMVEESTFEVLKDINAYVYSMKKNNCTRTIYYTDILAVTEKNHSFVKNAILEYKKAWINK